MNGKGEVVEIVEIIELRNIRLGMEARVETQEISDSLEKGSSLEVHCTL